MKKIPQKGHYQSLKKRQKLRKRQKKGITPERAREKKR